MKVDNSCTYATRRTEELLVIELGRTKIYSASVENILWNSYNLIEEFDFIPENLNDLSIQQVEN